MKVAVVYNDDGDMKPSLNAIERRGEAAVIDSARDIAASLSERHEAILIPIARSLRDSLASIQAADPGIVFNLCEGVQGESRWESHFALLLEMVAIPFTGCSAIPLALCQDKALVKRLLASEGVSTPRGVALAREDAPPRVAGLLDQLGGRVIIKPSREDGGIGIAKGSVVHNDAGLTKRISFIHSTYDQPALVEEFIDGDELNLAFYQGSDGWVFLPPGEVAFADSLSVEQRIVGWRAKWEEGSPEDLATVSRTARLPEAERLELERVAGSIARVLGIDGYCRLDFRRNRAGRLYVIDVNPNPDIGPGSGFRKALSAAGIPFAEFLDALIMARPSKRDVRQVSSS